MATQCCFYCLFWYVFTIFYVVLGKVLEKFHLRGNILRVFSELKCTYITIIYCKNSVHFEGIVDVSGPQIFIYLQPVFVPNAK